MKALKGQFRTTALLALRRRCGVQGIVRPLLRMCGVCAAAAVFALGPDAAAQPGSASRKYVPKPADFAIVCTLFNGAPPGPAVTSPEVPITYDAHIRIGARVEQVKFGKSPWPVGARLNFLIHSPAMLFGGTFDREQFVLTFSPFRPRTEHDKVWFAPETRYLLQAVSVHGPASARVVVVGAFSNIRYTEEHAYGQAVQLWRQGNRLLGLFKYTDGLQADFHTGLLEHVRFKPATGELSFDAYASQFHFDGRLQRTMVKGMLKRMHPDDGRQVANESVVLKRSVGFTESMRDYRSEEEWNRDAAEVLKRLGPRPR